jgi:hypothetical protein
MNTQPALCARRHRQALIAVYRKNIASDDNGDNAMIGSLRDAAGANCARVNWTVHQ